MMQLHITRNKRSDPVVYEVTFLLKDDGHDPRIVPPHLSQLSLEILAQQWLATRDLPPHKDANAFLVQRVPGWSAANIAQLEKGLTLSSPDSVLIAGVEERVKRACWVIADNYLYKAHFAERESFVIPIVPADTVDRPQPSGHAVQPCSPTTIQAARNRQ